MASVPLAPIRQPRGPSANSFGAPQTSSDGPPAPDSESLLRRHNTVSAPRHQPSASISANPAASSAFHGAGSRTRSGGVSRFRSGSLSSGTPELGLVRKPSGREVRKEEAVPEHVFEEGASALEALAWGRGLSRQSSLPSRRMVNPALTAVQAEPTKPGSMGPPPRPPRRISQNPPQTPATHMPSHSLSSLTMLSAPVNPAVQAEDPDQLRSGASVSRTQSLRQQAKHAEGGGLGRSTSLKAVGEHYRPNALSPPSQNSTPRHPFTPPTPPPVSSTAAFPPFQLPPSDPQHAHAQYDRTPGADLKRHQSLTQGYGSSSRVRDRLERSPAILSMEQREDVRRRMNSARSPDGEQPPISPIVPSVWSPSHPTGQDDGWSRAASMQLQDAFEAMNLGRRMMTPSTGETMHDGRNTDEDRLRQQPMTAGPASMVQSGEEPSWVTSLVGSAPTPQFAPRSIGPTSSGWQDREPVMRQHSFTPQPRQQPMPGWPGPEAMYMGQPQLNMLQQQQFMTAGGFMGMKPPYQQSFQSPYLGTPFNPGFPSQSMPNHQGQAPHTSEQDRDVIELARQKGLNPATFDCRPPAARFFVIKSYTEEDVQKSLKHEIWSSTVLGNKRLDGAFRESADKCPIYLFFSVNGSRHFCGVSRMLTPVDESQTSTVWAQDKWKGIFKVKWIFVRDVPSTALRHIRLTNTPENKPITNSRDTQELPYEAGCEVLQIFLDHQSKSKTSLLQDFAYYERLSANRATQGQPISGGPPNTALPTTNQQMMPPGPPMPYQMPLTGPMGAPANAAPPVPMVPARFR
ncbi:hypothetical protein IAU60_004589 [Kwoniella sp. DSM 27419]